MDLDDLKRSLEMRLDQLMGRISQIDSELRSPGTGDSEDRATESENTEVLDKLSVSERREAQDIRAALDRIRDGKYAICASCGRPIAAERLAALPYTSICVRCATV